MTEYINIINQEAITRPLVWPVVVVGCIGIAFAIAALVVLFIGHIKYKFYYENYAIKLLMHAAALIPIMLVTMAICSIWFQKETGRYRYEGTLDPSMTIVKFEEFTQQYDNVRFEDGVWKWEDKE